MTVAELKSATEQWTRNKSDELAVKNGCWFDPKQGAWTVWWIERFCRLYEGERAGEPLILNGCHECDHSHLYALDEWDEEQSLLRAELFSECVSKGHRVDWQYECTMRIFGWMKYSERWGREIRRFRQATVFVPKKNKKSPSLAAWGLYLLCGDGEPGQKVFLGAKDGSQAREIAGKHAVEMVSSSPELMESCSINKNMMQITHEDSRSTLKPMSSSSSRTQQSKEGINGSVLIDEIHVVDRAFVKRIKRAGISRSEPLHIEVSTAGNDPDGYGKERYDYAKKVANGEDGFVNESLFFATYEVPQDLSDDELDTAPVKYGMMANPAWGHTVGEEEYLADYNESKRSKSELADFKMYRLNIWQQAVNPWLDIGDWDACYENYTEESLRGKTCIAGLDLSLTYDMTAMVLMFPEWGENGLESVRQLPYFWLPQKTSDDNRHLAPFLEWEAGGFLELTPGSVVDYGFIFARIKALAEIYNIAEIGYDKTYAENLTQSIEQGLVDDNGNVLMEGVGIPRCIVNQTIMTLAGPTKQYERMVIEGTMHHNGHPVLRWQAGHATYKTDANANIRVVKPEPKDIKKVDGIVAAINGLARVLEGERELPSVYNRRSMIFIN